MLIRFAFADIGNVEDLWAFRVRELKSTVVFRRRMEKPACFDTG